MAIDPYLNKELLDLIEAAEEKKLNIMKRRVPVGSGNTADIVFSFKGNALRKPESKIFESLPTDFRRKLIGTIAESGWRTFLPGTSGNVSVFSKHLALHGNGNIAINCSRVKSSEGDNSIFVSSQRVESTGSSNSVFCEVNDGGTKGNTALINCPESMIFRTKLLKGLDSPHIMSNDSERVQSIQGRDNVFESTERSVVEGCVETRLENCEDVKVTNSRRALIKNTTKSSPVFTFADLRKITVDDGELLTRWVRFIKLFKRT